MAVATAIAVAGLAVSAVGVGVSIYEGNQAVAAQNRALQYQQQAQQYQEMQQKRQAVRQSRIAYAQAQQNAENQGAGYSSGSQGGLGSIKSQLNEQLSFLDSQYSLAKQAGTELGAANVFKSRAETFGAIASVGMKAFSSAPYIASVFGGATNAGQPVTSSGFGSYSGTPGVFNGGTSGFQYTGTDIWSV